MEAAQKIKVGRDQTNRNSEKQKERRETHLLGAKNVKKHGRNKSYVRKKTENLSKNWQTKRETKYRTHKDTRPQRKKKSRKLTLISITDRNLSQKLTNDNVVEESEITHTKREWNKPIQRAQK